MICCGFAGAESYVKADKRSKRAMKSIRRCKQKRCLGTHSPALMHSVKSSPHALPRLSLFPFVRLVLVCRRQMEEVSEESRKRKLDIDLLLHRIKQLEAADVVPRSELEVHLSPTYTLLCVANRLSNTCVILQTHKLTQSLSRELASRQAVIRERDEHIAARDATLTAKDKEIARLNKEMVGAPTDLRRFAMNDRVCCVVSGVSSGV
jgi:hypothetical protein